MKIKKQNVSVHKYIHWYERIHLDYSVEDIKGWLSVPVVRGNKKIHLWKLKRIETKYE